jgi:hypothetical protein
VTWCSSPRSGGGDSGGLAFLTRARQHCGTLGIVAICTLFLCVLLNEAVSCWDYVASVTDEWVWDAWWNDNERGKSKYTEKKICLSATLSTTYPTWAVRESNQGLRGEGLATKQAPEPLYGLQFKSYKTENHIHQYGCAGYALAQLVEVLRYKPEGRGFCSQWFNPSGRTMALGWTQFVTEMSTGGISWRVKVAGAWGWQPCHLHVPTV